MLHEAQELVLGQRLLGQVIPGAVGGMGTNACCQYRRGGADLC